MIHQLELVALPVPPTRGRPVLACRLPVEPQVAQRMRARAMCARGRWMAQVYDDALYAAWKREAVELLTTYWAGRPPIRMWCVAQVVLVAERPSKPVRSVTCDGEPLAYQWPWTSGRNPYAGVADLDNLRKGPLDALKRARIIADDRLLNEDGGSKVVYAAEGEEPCVEVRMWQA